MSDVPKTSEQTGLSNWELALCIGVPVAALCLAGGVYYYINKDKKAIKKEDGEENPSKDIEIQKKETEELVREKVSLQHHNRHSPPN